MLAISASCPDRIHLLRYRRVHHVLLDKLKVVTQVSQIFDVLCPIWLLVALLGGGFVLLNLSESMRCIILPAPEFCLMAQTSGWDRTSPSKVTCGSEPKRRAEGQRQVSHVGRERA